MASQGESKDCKLPLPSVKDKRRSHIPSPRSFRKTVSKPVTPDPVPRHGSSLGEPSAASMSTDLSPESPYRLGDRVCIAGVKPGILRYYGRTQFAEGEWCGIELDDCEGKHNGTVDSLTYFSCKDGYGIFAPSFKVQPLNEWVLPERPSKLHTPKTTGIPGIPKLRATRSKSPEDICSSEKKLKKSLSDLTGGDSSSLPQSPRFVSKLARPKSIGCDPRGLPRAFPGEEGEVTEKSPLQTDSRRPPPRPSKQASGLPVKRSHSALEAGDVKKYHSAIPKPGSKKESLTKAAVAKTSGEHLLTQSEYNEGTRSVSRSERAAKVRSLSYDLTADGQSPFSLGLSSKDSALRSSSSSLCSRSSSGSLISPKPDKAGHSLTQTKKTPLVFGGEAMSEPEDESELLCRPRLTHASSLGILPDSVLCNNSLVSEEIRGAGKDLKSHSMEESKDSTEMMEKDLDHEISGISTPEIDMSGSTISGKDLCSSPEVENKRDLNNYEGEVVGEVVGEVKRQEAEAGEMPASPSSSEETSPNTEIQLTTKVDEDEVIITNPDDPEQYPSGIRTSIDLEELDSTSMTASVEIAKTAVQQYAELMAAAERERRASLKHREARKARREAERARSIDSDEEAFITIKTDYSDRAAVDTESTQLLVDLQAGHTKRDRPVSMISVGSADTGIVSDISTTPSKRERPLSLISTSSVDTGYQPDTDSEIGTLTMNSPLEDESTRNNNQAEELSPRSEALSLDAAYKDTFSRFQKVFQKGTMRENETEPYNDTGTLAAEREAEVPEADTDIHDLIIQNTLLEYGLEEMLQSVPRGRRSPVDGELSPDFPQNSPDGSMEDEDEDLALYEGTQTPLSDIHVPMETIPEQDTPESPEMEFPGQKEPSTVNDTTSTVSVTSDNELDTDLADDHNNAKPTPDTVDNAMEQSQPLDNAKDNALLDLDLDNACNNPPETSSQQESVLVSTELLQSSISEVNQNTPVSVSTTLPEILDAPMSSLRDQVATLEHLDNREMIFSKIGPMDVHADFVVNRVDHGCVQGLPPPDEPDTMVLSSQEESGLSELESPNSPVREVNRNLQIVPEAHDLAAAGIASLDQGLGNVVPDQVGEQIGQKSDTETQEKIVTEEVITPTRAEPVQASLPLMEAPNIQPSQDEQPALSEAMLEEQPTLSEAMLEELIIPAVTDSSDKEKDIQESTGKTEQEEVVEESIYAVQHESLEQQPAAVNAFEQFDSLIQDKEALSKEADTLPQASSQSETVLPEPIEPETEMVSESKPEVQEMATDVTDSAPVAELPLQPQPVAELPLQPVAELPLQPVAELPLQPVAELPLQPQPVAELPLQPQPVAEFPLQPQPVAELPLQPQPVAVTEDIITPVESHMLDREPPRPVLVEDLIQPESSQVVEKPFLQSNLEDLILQPSPVITDQIIQGKDETQGEEPVVLPPDISDVISKETTDIDKDTSVEDTEKDVSKDSLDAADRTELPEVKEEAGLPEILDEKKTEKEEKQEEGKEEESEVKEDQTPKVDENSTVDNGTKSELNSEELLLAISKEATFVVDEDKDIVNEPDQEKAELISKADEETSKSEDARNGIVADQDVLVETLEITEGPVIRTSTPVIEVPEEGSLSSDKINDTDIADTTTDSISLPGSISLPITTNGTEKVDSDPSMEHMNGTESGNTTGDMEPLTDSLNTTFSEGEQMPQICEIEIVSEMSESTIKDQGPTEKELLQTAREAKAIVEKEKCGESSGDEKKKKNGVTKVTKGKRIEDVGKVDEKKPVRTTRTSLTSRTKPTPTPTTTKTTTTSTLKNKSLKPTTTKSTVPPTRKIDTDKKTPTPKVSPRITDLNKRPAPKKPSDNTIIVNNVKTAKNNTNLKKADSTAMKSTVPSLKRNPPPKSKWGNIMSQIDNSKGGKKPTAPTKTSDVKTRTKPSTTTAGDNKTTTTTTTSKTTKTTSTAGKSTTSTSTTSRSPRDVTTRPTTTARRTGSANTTDGKSKTSSSLKVSRTSSVSSTARSKQSPDPPPSPRPDSRMSAASDASGLNSSRTGSLAGSRPTSAGKPENRKTASLRREKSPSVCSESSTSSQLSSQGSRTPRTRTRGYDPSAKTEPAKPTTTRRRSIAEPTPSSRDTRRSSLATSARQPTKKDSSPAPAGDKKVSSK